MKMGLLGYRLEESSTTGAANSKVEILTLWAHSVKGEVADEQTARKKFETAGVLTFILLFIPISTSFLASKRYNHVYCRPYITIIIQFNNH